MVLCLYVGVSVIKLEIHRLGLTTLPRLSPLVECFFLIGATGLGRCAGVRCPQLLSALGERLHHLGMLRSPPEPLTVGDLVLEVLKSVSDVYGRVP